MIWRAHGIRPCRHIEQIAAVTAKSLTSLDRFSVHKHSHGNIVTSQLYLECHTKLRARILFWEIKQSDMIARNHSIHTPSACNKIYLGKEPRQSRNLMQLGQYTVQCSADIEITRVQPRKVTNRYKLNEKRDDSA